MAFTIFERWSPEYALNNTFEDMNKSGVDGLEMPKFEKFEVSQEDS